MRLQSISPYRELLVSSFHALPAAQLIVMSGEQITSLKDEIKCMDGKSSSSLIFVVKMEMKKNCSRQ